jgi:hypothetical protein
VNAKRCVCFKKFGLLCCHSCSLYVRPVWVVCFGRHEGTRRAAVVVFQRKQKTHFPLSSQMQRDEKKMQIEIKQLAKKGQMPAARIMAKDLVRTRNAISKFYQMKAQLQAVSIRIQTMSSTAAMADSMKGEGVRLTLFVIVDVFIFLGAARAMYQMNRQVNLPAMQRIMMQFEKEGEMMEMKQELMDDTIDGVMNQEGDAENEEEVRVKRFLNYGIFKKTM